MEENIQKFTERLRELVAQGKKKKSILEIQEINDFFADMELEAEQMEKSIWKPTILTYCVSAVTMIWT